MGTVVGATDTTGHIKTAYYYRFIRLLQTAAVATPVNATYIHYNSYSQYCTPLW